MAAAERSNSRWGKARRMGMSAGDQANAKKGGIFSRLRMPFGRATDAEGVDVQEPLQPAGATEPLPQPPPPGATQGGVDSEQFARIASILRELETTAAKPENAVELPMSTVLNLVPGRYRKMAAGDVDLEQRVTVFIENLFDQLACGRIAIPLALLVLDLPPELVESEANKDYTTLVVLPLDEVVGAIQPEALTRGMAALALSPLVGRLPDPFSSGETTDVTLSAPAPRVVPAPPPPQPAPAAAREPEKTAPRELTAKEAAELARAVPSWVSEAAHERASAEAPIPEKPHPAAEAVRVIVPVVQPKEHMPAPKPLVAPPAPPPPAAPSASVVPQPSPVQAPAKPVVSAVRPEPREDVSIDYGERLHGIDINTATAAQLGSLPGATPAVGRNIIEFRSAHGPFRSVFDLIRVPHVGRITFRKLTGMPCNARQRHRIHKLSHLLDIPVDRVHRLPLIAEKLSARPGFDGCVISDEDGMVLAMHAADTYGTTLGALAPRLLKRIEESVRELDQEAVNSMSLSIGDRMFTVVRSGNIFVCTRHRRRRLTMNDLMLTERVAGELAWMLSHRACVGAGEAKAAGAAASG
jgi:hypothetical protein